jgi:hypothetical protein
MEIDHYKNNKDNLMITTMMMIMMIVISQKYDHRGFAKL